MQNKKLKNENLDSSDSDCDLHDSINSIVHSNCNDSESEIDVEFDTVKPEIVSKSIRVFFRI